MFCVDYMVSLQYISHFTFVAVALWLQLERSVLLIPCVRIKSYHFYSFPVFRTLWSWFPIGLPHIIICARMAPDLSERFHNLFLSSYARTLVAYFYFLAKRNIILFILVVNELFATHKVQISESVSVVRQHTVYGNNVFCFLSSERRQPSIRAIIIYSQWKSKMKLKTECAMFIFDLRHNGFCAFYEKRKLKRINYLSLIVWLSDDMSKYWNKCE